MSGVLLPPPFFLVVSSEERTSSVSAPILWSRMFLILAAPGSSSLLPWDPRVPNVRAQPEQEPGIFGCGCWWQMVVEKNLTSSQCCLDLPELAEKQDPREACISKSLPLGAVWWWNFDFQVLKVFCCWFLQPRHLAVSPSCLSTCVFGLTLRFLTGA